MPSDVDNGLAVTPPMGWNSWNAFGESVGETVIRGTADAMASSGLKECGYRYIVIDDCWSAKEGRDRNGDLIPDPIRFPSGIRPLADHVHDLGFELGIYSDAAERTCAGYPGSYGYEEQDAQLWASWGIDLLKYDYCHAPRDREAAIDRYSRMGEALRATGHPFVYAICEWGGRSPYRWGRQVGGHMWRVSDDVLDRWEDVDRAFDIAAEVHPYGRSGGWNDLDMLVVGLNGRGQIPGAGMTLDEYRTQMSMWCMACSPLMIGCDVRGMDPPTASILKNRDVLAVNQDALGVAARRVRRTADVEVWVKPLSDDSVAVALVNRGASATDVTVRASELGLPEGPKPMRDLWTSAADELGRAMTAPLASHATTLLRIGMP